MSHRMSRSNLPTFLVLPEMLSPRRGERTLLVLADGNRRSRAGYAGGARAVVSVAEHLARRADVATMIACVLSPDNVAKRGDRFFAALYAQFVELGAAITLHGALLGAGVRAEIVGDLGPLRARGGHAALLADAILAVARATASVTAPALRLLLGVGYAPDLAVTHDADVVLRTGVEEPSALRLSGLVTHARAVHVARTTLWPEMTPADIDDVLDEAAGRAVPALAEGHDEAAIEALARALSEAALPVPVCVAVIARDPAIAGARAAGAAELAVVSPCTAPRGASVAVIAPGQRPPCFLLPGGLDTGSATIHPAEASPAGLIAAMDAALRFAAAHPPLAGAERAVIDAPAARDPAAEAFADEALAWADARALLPAEPAIRRAARGYALTAFHMHDGVTARRRAHADLAARFMLLVTAGDEGIFDRVFAGEGEDDDARRARLLASARYLADPARDAPAPDIPGAPLLAAIAAGFREIIAAAAPTAHPDLLHAFRAGLADLYDKSVAEHFPAPSRRPPPAVIAARLAAADDAERAVLGYLIDAASAVGAGLLFRAAALAAPAAEVPPGGAAALDRAAALIDHAVRLANDASSFLSSPSGDRDPKRNSCTLLVPASASGVARAEAVVRALAVSRRLSAWIQDELSRAMAQLDEAWPWMGAVFRRGAHIGRRVYEIGHYTTIDPAEVSAVAAEISP